MRDDALGVLKDPESFLLKPEDYDIYMNPIITAETNAQQYDWEYCLSFPGLRSMVKRPVSIEVSFLDEKGNEKEERFDCFKARVFMHELDHLNGQSMTHWRVSEGNIEVIDGKEK